MCLTDPFVDKFHLQVFWIQARNFWVKLFRGQSINQALDYEKASCVLQKVPQKRTKRALAKKIFYPSCSTESYWTFSTYREVILEHSQENTHQTEDNGIPFKNVLETESHWPERSPVQSSFKFPHYISSYWLADFFFFFCSHQNSQ